MADTRDRILSAACDEFASRGFAATTVDRIAKRARVNKAMIYYHFASKRALYGAIIRDVYARIAADLGAVMAENQPPDRTLDALIIAFVRNVDRSRHFIPLFFREIADGAIHLGPEELKLLATIFGTVRGVIAEGTKQKQFQPVHPGLAHFTLIGPLVMFRASAPVRERIRQTQKIEIPDANSDELVAHLQMVARRMLMPLAERRKADR